MFNLIPSMQDVNKAKVILIKVTSNLTFFWSCKLDAIFINMQALCYLETQHLKKQIKVNILNIILHHLSMTFFEGNWLVKIHGEQQPTEYFLDATDLHPMKGEW